MCKIEFFVEARLKLDNNIVNDIWDRKDFQVLDPVDLNQLILPDVTVCYICTLIKLIRAINYFFAYAEILSAREPKDRHIQKVFLNS